jgi:hypothetical protein
MEHERPEEADQPPQIEVTIPAHMSPSDIGDLWDLFPPDVQDILRPSFERAVKRHLGIQDDAVDELPSE